MTYEEYLAAEAAHETLVQRVERVYTPQLSAQVRASFVHIQELRAQYPQYADRRDRESRP